MRPLDRIPSLKLKLGAVIVGTVVGTVAVIVLGNRLGLPLSVRVIAATVIGLVVVQFLARGMTSPLREMAVASRAMAAGDYDRRVTATSRDEVGELARAFNAMAADLADVERQRRDLVANVSHELRTPIGALQALLENLADGVEPAEPRAIEAALGQTRRLAKLVNQLLDLSRWEADAVVLERRPFEVEGLLAQAAQECAAGCGRGRPGRRRGDAGGARAERRPRTPRPGHDQSRGQRDPPLPARRAGMPVCGQRSGAGARDR